jgi:tRNA (guanine37-N1)-methyltransferase
MKALRGVKKKKNSRTILLAPAGKRFDQKSAKRLSKYDQLIFVCPRYEGVDERVNKMVDEKISIGDYVLTGGELPALVIMDAVSRHYPGFVGKQESIVDESFSKDRYLEYPQYTRPDEIKYQGKKLKVPSILLSGNHAKIKEWREKKSKVAK